MASLDSDRTSLIIFHRSDMKQTGHVTLPLKTHAGKLVKSVEEFRRR